MRRRIPSGATAPPNIDRTVMTHVVTESCIACRYTDCVDVCPVDCFREGPNFLAIDPDECIDCAVCVAECPVNAIFAEEDVPGDQQAFIKSTSTWPVTGHRLPRPSLACRKPSNSRTSRTSWTCWYAKAHRRNKKAAETLLFCFKDTINDFFIQVWRVDTLARKVWRCAR